MQQRMVRSGSSINADVIENILENYKNDACLYYFCTSCGLSDIAAHTHNIITLSVKYHWNRTHDHRSSSLLFGFLCYDMWTVICLWSMYCLPLLIIQIRIYAYTCCFFYQLIYFQEIWEHSGKTTWLSIDILESFRKHTQSESWSAYIKKTNYNINMKTWTR